MIEGTEDSTLQELFKEAEALWQKVSELAHGELAALIEGAGHEILMDIAKDTDIKWDKEVRNLAKLLYHQGEVVGILDELRHREPKVDNA
jgi:hypothetical protein